MAFCPQCGSAVEGNFCAKCGASVAGASAGAAGTGPVYTSPPAAASGLTDNVAGALAYIPIVGIIFLLIEPYNRNKLIRFHAFQGLFLLAAVIVLNIVVGILATILWSLWILYAVIRLAFAVIWIYCMYKAFINEKVVLPVIGPIAEKQA